MHPADPSARGARERLFAVGDIHACADELDVLLDALGLAAGDKIVFVGDYIDRGPSARAVIDRLLEVRRQRGVESVFLKGNHEDMFLAYLGEPGRHGDAFLLNGGRATLASYGISPFARESEVRGSLPVAHLDFLRSLEIWNRDGRFFERWGREVSFLFVHAGIAPLRPLEAQDEEDLLWIREEFIRNRHRLRDTVIFGHTPQREVLWHLPWKIGLDTGCVYGNKLSCLEITTATLFQVQRDASRVTRRSVEAELAALAAA